MMIEPRDPTSKRAVTYADGHRALAVLRRQLAAVTRDRYRAASCTDARLRSLLRQHEHDVVERMAEFTQWFEVPEAIPHGLPHEPEAAAALPDVPPPVPSSGSTDQTEAVVRPAKNPGPREVRVVARQNVAEHGLIFRLERPPQFTFQPGQYVRLALSGIRRNYSIVSAPHEPFLEFFADLVPGGRMSARLGALRIGEVVTLASGPRGRLTMDGGFPEHVMVATGSGIAPFVSILRAHLASAEKRHRFHVFHGVSYRDEFGYHNELDAMATTHPQQMTYLPTVSRPEDQRNAGWSGVTGRVHSLLEPYLPQNRLTPENTVIYACGNSGMIRAVQQQFSSRGFTIRTERFW